MSRLPPNIEQVIDGVSVVGNTVRPISRDGITYTLSVLNRENETGGIVGREHFVTATDAEGNTLWRTVYTMVNFDTDLETDVQEQFPVDFYFHENGIELVIKHEHYTDNDRVFHVMLADGNEKLKSVA